MMMLKKLLLFIFSVSVAYAQPESVNNYQVFYIESTDAVETSGLVIRDNVLYTVSDDHNDIYKISLQDETAVLSIEHNLDAMQLSVLNFDLEGITVVDGEFFVVSETHHKLIRLKGDKLEWVPDYGSVYPDAAKIGLFKTRGAGIEAVTYLGDHTFLMAVERQPRGLIEVTLDDEFKNIVHQSNQLFDPSEHLSEGSRAPDLTGLYHYDGKTYALHRNANVIIELIKNKSGQYVEGKSWSFANIIYNPEYAYEDNTYGFAEGLAVDDDYFYVVIDNNGISRANNVEDKHPLLIRIQR